MGIGYSEGVVKRGMTLERFADITVDQRGEDLRALSEEGRHRRRAATPTSCFIDPTIRKTLAATTST